MVEWPTALVLGQKSFLLKTNSVELALTVSGGMLGPVTFRPEEGTTIAPYAVAPWAEESVGPDTAAVLRSLRGDWFCSAFGANEQSHAGAQLPLHGETANNRWTFEAGRTTKAGAWLRIGLDLPLQGGRCEATTALLTGQTVIYQRHALSALTGPINPGHHSTLAFPNREGAGRLSFSPHILAKTFPEPVENDDSRGRSFLALDNDIADLTRAKGVDGATTDLLSFPARRGFEDTALICADPAHEYAWSAVTFAQERYVWFSLRNTRQLSSTLLWFSNGGRYYPPWNGRHINVMGIEDITAYFAAGIGASCRANPLSMKGIRTCLEPDEAGRLSIPYIQGIACIPESFGCLVRMQYRPGSLQLVGASGASVTVGCQTDFLRTGRLPEFPFD